MGGTVASTGATIGVGGSAAANAAALTATPSFSILAGSGYGVGGSMATTLGGETAVANTGLTGSTTGSNALTWFNRARQANSLLQNNNGQGGDNSPLQPKPWINFNSDFGNNQQTNYLPTMPISTTELLNQGNNPYAN
ncbi:hypothetical protein JXH92_003679 [Salmonella enterica subsp. enterica serovar 4,[5],12:b:-]|nr:hypothetical protein [Salmonella enterica subsp. enterica serovar 4,[5],12:b:-]